MTNAPQPKAIPIPALLVYGKPTSPDVPQASWFHIEDRVAIMAAAATLKLSVVEVPADSDRSQLDGIHEGVLKGAGRMIVGSITPAAYKRIEDYAARSAGALAATAPSTIATDFKCTSEQSMNSRKGVVPVSVTLSKTGDHISNTAKPTVAAIPAAPPHDKPKQAAETTHPKETLREGALVLAAYWGEEREFEGFWLATVKRIESGEFTLEWLDSPEYPPFKATPKNIAVPHPDFRPSRK